MMDGEKRIVVGTRGSALALAQAEMTEAALREAFPGVEIVRKVIKTTGDRRTDVPLVEVAKAEGHLDKGVFIKELELALDAGEIDVAVHSLKDMPSDLEKGFALAAVLERAPVGDVLVTKNSGGLAVLPEGATVATSSVRRQRMLKAMRNDLQLADIRGNVPTRLRKLAEQDDLGGVILAEAGLVRLGLLEDGMVRSGGHELHAERLDGAEFYPAAGQGAVALEIREADERMRTLCAALNHAVTEAAVTAERAFLLLLGAGCETPVGVRTEVDGEVLRMWAKVFEDGEAAPLEAEAEGCIDNIEAVAAALRDKLTRTES
jgi:hydroxymethylbilane synthase